ncbi:MAG: DUF4271 domain-containing protein [Chitinophagaceae bacterium]
MKYLIYLFFFFFAETLAAQTPVTDSTAVRQAPAAADTVIKPKKVKIKKDSTQLVKRNIDSLQAVKKDTTAIATAQTPLPIAADTVLKKISYKAVLKQNPYFNFFGSPQNLMAELRKSNGSKDALFYIFTGLLLFFALVKIFFSKYVGHLTGLAFRGSLRQKQIREQLLQTPLPSLFLNIFFVIVAGLYVFFLVQHYNAAPATGFWLLLLYCILAVTAVYLAKFVILKATGWIFNMRDAADTYIFIVFLVNKLLAIFLLPLLIMMVFSIPSWTEVLLTLSFVLVGGFFAYRYLASFGPVRREVKVSQFHFFMYLCAFEIIPLLLIYKVLVSFF